jgi:predicted dehydrogenase
MVGGGEGSFIGNVHRMAARLDGAYELVAGAFSRDHDNCLQTGTDLGLEASRCYPGWEAMLACESVMDDDIRAECIAIVAPNDVHYPVAKAAVAKGFHIISDKPATLDLAEARKLENIIQDSGVLYGLTHTYLGYPMVAEARHKVATGSLGTVRKVYVEYHQGWLATAQETLGNKQAEWRNDPARAGQGGAIGDIGTHAFTLAEWITGQHVNALCAELNTHVEGRQVDDDAAALLRFDGGASGVLVCSQVCAGEENALKIRVYGEMGGLEWQQMEPNNLLLRPADAPSRILRAGVNQSLCELARSRCRTPGGHPEGYLEAFANLYRDFATAIRSGEKGTATNVPGIDMGKRGMKFIQRMIESENSAYQWTNFEDGGKEGASA